MSLWKSLTIWKFNQHIRNDSKLWIQRYSCFPDTVSQFTGKLDKNKKEVYEKDIITGKVGDNDNYVEVCKYEKRFCSFIFGKKTNSRSSRKTVTVNSVIGLRVIGNEIDDKELIPFD